MFVYLSPAWIDAMHDALRRHERLQDATRSWRTPFVVQHHVTGRDGTVVSYAIRLGADGNSVSQGSQPDQDVSFTSDGATATAIMTGVESAQAAFLAGRLRIGGDPQRLIAHQAALTDLDDAFSNVRAQTILSDDETTGSADVVPVSERADTGDHPSTETGSGPATG